MKNFLSLLFIIPLSVFYYSCGDSDDDTVVIQQEQPDGGTTGGTTGGSGSCMTSTQRNNLRSLLNRVSAIDPILGEATERVVNADGSTSFFDFDQAIYDFFPISENLWRVNGQTCEDDMCIPRQAQLGFLDNCFNYNGNKAKINSASSSRASITTTMVENGQTVTVNSVLSVSSSGRVRISEDTLLSGKNINRFRFSSDSSGGGDDQDDDDDTTTTGGETTGGETTGGTAGGTVGGTAGGFSTL